MGTFPHLEPFTLNTYRITQNGWVRRDLKNHEAPIPMPHAGPPISISNTRAGCRGRHPALPWKPPGTEHPPPPHPLVNFGMNRKISYPFLGHRACKCFKWLILSIFSLFVLVFLVEKALRNTSCTEVLIDAMFLLPHCVIHLGSKTLNPENKF